MLRVLYIPPSRFNPHADTGSLTRQAIAIAQVSVKESLQFVHTVEPLNAEEAIDDAFTGIEDADLLVVDISGKNLSHYWLGVADGLRKPVVVLVDHDLSLLDRPFLWYDPAGFSPGLDKRLAELIVEALTDVEKFRFRDKSLPRSRHTVFVSYSHSDRSCLERLKVHLKPLERKGLLDLWSDTKIKAGEEWQEEIQNALDRAVIAVLLVSADFLASDFIVDNELPPLLKAAEKKGTTILPVVIRPCRFLREPNLSKFQALNDPARPLLAEEPIRQEELYVQLANRVEDELHARGPIG